MNHSWGSGGAEIVEPTSGKPKAALGKCPPLCWFQPNQVLNRKCRFSCESVVDRYVLNPDAVYVIAGCQEILVENDPG